MRLHRVLLTAVAAAALSSSGSSAQAQCGGYGFGFGGFYDVGYLYNVLANNVPYYAAFPPVYYSVPVPRTYGHSPFAYLPTHETPEVEHVAPLAINNPFVRPNAPKTEATPAAKQPADRLTTSPAAPQPLVINNPYFRARHNGEGPVLQAASIRR